MFSCLLSLALVEATVPADFSAELVLPRTSLHQARLAGATPLAKLVFVRTAAESVHAERDCIDESDTSDESSSPKERTEKLGGWMTRYALALYRAQLEQTVAAPREVSLPLFYAFCRLLL